MLETSQTVGVTVKLILLEVHATPTFTARTGIILIKLIIGAVHEGISHVPSVADRSCSF
jgi:hypothetical protein